jgi:ring-1,2-phenylacetyl-CoA epoxidase subunit PaaD
MVTHDDILDVLRTIDDPEMAINIVDLGLVERVETEARDQRSEVGGQRSADGVWVSIEILPTFVGCHALSVIENDIRRRVGELAGVAGVEVRVSYSPPWHVGRITSAGREVLRHHGIMVPGADDALNVAACPWCGSTAVHQENAFGPTRCRTIWYCDACRNPFERLKRVANAGLTELSVGKLKR